MKNNKLVAVLLLTFMAGFTACDVIGGIFKTGVGVGVFIVVVIIIIILVIRGMTRRP